MKAAQFLFWIAIASAIGVGCDLARGELTLWRVALPIIIAAVALVLWRLYGGQSSGAKRAVCPRCGLESAEEGALCWYCSRPA